ncbi:MAG: ribosome-binding factor A [Candidatus Marinamargulisbacteria bacterium]|jgi:ribosome-binding factor A
MSRRERLSSILKKEISQILNRRINDSRIGFISITEVTVSKDFAHAMVYYSQIGSDEEKEKTKKGLYSSQKFIKAEVGRVVRIHTVPDIHFKFDDSLERGVDLVQKIDRLE